MRYAEINWVDDQPYSERFDDVYYSVGDGLSETEYVFIHQNNLIDRFTIAQRFTIAEAGFGTGLNFVATCRHWLENSSEGSVLYYVGIEKHPVSPDDIRRVSQNWNELKPLFDELLAYYPQAIPGPHLLSLFDGRVQLVLEFSSASEALQGHRFTADSWFLDGFNPKHNVEMWDDDFVDQIARHSKAGTSLSTYTAAGHVRRRLIDAGFDVKKVKGHGNKREMICANLIQNTSYQSAYPWYEVPPQSYPDKTAIVLGAGLAGLTTARALIDKGWQVTLIDRHEKVAQEASGNPAGVLLPRMTLGNASEQQFFVNAFFYAVSQLDQLQKESDTEFWFKTGVCSQEPQAKAETILAQYLSNQEFVQEVYDVAINGGSEKHKTVRYPSAGWVCIDSLCAELYKRIENKVTYINATVNEIKQKDHYWHVFSDNSEQASASVLVLASGQSLHAINQISWLPVKSIRGQVTAVNATDSSKSMSQAYSFGRFLTPHHNGVHYTGASYDLDDMSSKLSSISQDENLQHLSENISEKFIKPDCLTGRVGFRAVSEDRMPIVGMVPDKGWYAKHYADLRHGRAVDKYLPAQVHSGLYVNGAHGSRGLTTSFLSAELLLSLIEATPQPIATDAMHALSPSRFLIRRLKRNQNMSD